MRSDPCATIPDEPSERNAGLAVTLGEAVLQGHLVVPLWLGLRRLRGTRCCAVHSYWGRGRRGEAGGVNVIDTSSATYVVCLDVPIPFFPEFVEDVRFARGFPRVICARSPFPGPQWLSR